MPFRLSAEHDSGLQNSHPAAQVNMPREILLRHDAHKAAAGMAAHLPGVIAAMTPLPVIGVPIKASLDGLDALLAIAQMPPGIPVATVAINGALNAAILSLQIMANGDSALREKMKNYKQSLKEKIVKANDDLSKISFKYKV